jgi:signal transduction histidine kinase
MKLFSQAVWRLTAIYTLILMALSLSFSVMFLATTNFELDRPFRPIVENSRARTGDSSETLRNFVLERDQQTKQNLLVKLIFTNLGVLLVGAGASYLLARRTLRPISQAIQQQAQFVSNASHELRTPLAAVQMENEVTLRSKSSSISSLKKQIKSNLEEVAKLQDLTTNLLRLDQDKALETTELDLSKVAQKAVKTVKQMADEKNIKIVVTAETKMRANEAALVEILVILLDNAIKYSPNGKPVLVESGEAWMAVQDEGSGIASDELPHVFDRFYRGEKSRTSPGFGLGLSLAKGLAERMNCRISLHANRDSSGVRAVIKRPK